MQPALQPMQTTVGTRFAAGTILEAVPWRLEEYNCDLARKEKTMSPARRFVSRHLWHEACSRVEGGQHARDVLAMSHKAHVENADGLGL